jgi:tRNA threonylcarbamoyladenosine biosynthesis protein TsaB
VIVLGVDTATPATSVALKLADGTLLQARDDPTGGERPGHATRLLPLAAGLLEQAGLDWGEIERIAAGVGPGTFTGLRIGLASARGLAQTLEIPIVGVSSARALAHAASHAAGGERPYVVSVIDARRGEVFVAAYEHEQELLAPEPIAPEAVAPTILDVLAGAPPGGWLCVGDGAVRYREQIERDALRIPADDSPSHRVDARAICLLAEHAAVHEGQALPAVLPDYRRMPDAQPTAGRGSR